MGRGYGNRAMRWIRTLVVAGALLGAMLPADGGPGSGDSGDGG